MVNLNLIAVFALSFVVGLVRGEHAQALRTESSAQEFVNNVEVLASQHCSEAVFADWGFASNITDENQEASLKATLKLAQFKKEQWKNVTQFEWKNFQNPLLKRQFRLMSVLGTDALPEDKLQKYTTLVNDMSATYAKAKICDFNDPTKCDLSLEPDAKNILAKSRNYAELQHVWLAWRDASGKKMFQNYTEYVDLINEAARMNNFSTAVDMWLMSYESDTFKQDMFKLWDEILPLYEQLHAYVRRKLNEQYGPQVSKTGPIPAHVLGDMWSQHWSDLLNFTTPFPDKPSVEVTDAMVKQNYTALKMFKTSEAFFTSVNLTGMPEEFWTGSIIEKPDDREIICHASAWDFCNGKDFRIKQCTKTQMNDLVVVHHEMGHIEYYLQYKDQPITFREGANPGFHEAVGDLLALSVSTPKHLKELNLLTDFKDDYEFNINYLFAQAMDKVAFVPSALVIDQWRWDVFDGKIKPEDYNCHWWELRSKIQGVRPPVTRTSTDFDPGAKYHIPASVPYIRYFVSHILQFQFHKALCTVAGQYDPQDPEKPLHKCDIYKNAAAGNKLGAMLRLGSSKPWPEALEQVTGQMQMDASALLEYFKPLHDWLIEENAKSGEIVGWGSRADDTPDCVTASPPTPSAAPA